MKKNKTALVTGGAGFIGSELVSQLLEKQYSVIVYDNFSFGKHDNLPQNNSVNIVAGDLRDADLINATFSKYKPTYIFHMAALHFIPYCIANPQETIQVNVEGTLNVLEACKKIDIDSLVYASTAAVYPISDKAHKENDQTGPIEIYGATKLFGETLISLFHKETHSKCAIARLFNGFGRRETNPHVIPDILKQLPDGNTIHLGNVDPKRDFINTIDISRALIHMAESTDFNFDVFNVGTGKQTSVEDVVKVISKILNRPLTIVTEDERKRKVERINLVPEISKIKNSLGWEPKISLEEGFRDMLTYEGFV